MLRGDKSGYTDKQKRQAEHIEEGYEDRGIGRTLALGAVCFGEESRGHAQAQPGQGPSRLKRAHEVSDHLLQRLNGRATHLRLPPPATASTA